MPTKAELRKTFRARRDEVSAVEREAGSDRIRNRVLALPQLETASTVFVYVSVGSEVQTYTLIEGLLALGKTVAVPRITDLAGGLMDAVPIDSLKALVPAGGTAGKFGLLEPRGGQALDAPADLALVPGLAFSPTTGVRLGTGGGFYDRYFQQTPDTFAVGLAFDEQLENNLPADPHDQRVQAIATPTRLLPIAD